MIYIGLDPGASGGIAALWADGRVLCVRTMPDTVHDLVESLQDIAGQADAAMMTCHATLERVNAGVFVKNRKMGVVSAFTFGKGVGRIEASLAAANIPYDEVMPAKWQQYMGCRSHGEKNITKRRAQQLFPDQKVTHAIADSLLIAEYCRRVRTFAEAVVHG